MFKLKGDTLKSVNKEVDEEEERLYAELYKELEEVDRRISRTRRGGRKGGDGNVMSKGKGKGKGKSLSKRKGRGETSIRRGSGSGGAGGASSTAIEEENEIVAPREGFREPGYDDDGNLLSEGDFDFGSETSEEDIASDDFLASDHDSDDDSFTISP